MVNRLVVTGGAGYIGSHVCKAAAAKGWQVVTIDNLSTGFRELVRWGDLIEIDVRNTVDLTGVLRKIRPDAIVHLAASAYVGDSMVSPLTYYSNNLIGMHSILQACIDCKIDKIVFSSSCATYGIPDSCPISESSPLIPVSPYGETKLACERMLYWCEQAYKLGWLALRYFNAAGADPDGEIGEMHDPETHLIPLAIQSMVRGGSAFTVFGSNYPTKDGTAIRDFVHVSDLADAHVLAVEHLAKGGESRAVNLGTGRGHSVLEVIHAIESISGKKLSYEIGDRRPGDPPELFAMADIANTLLTWKPEFIDIKDIVRTAWEWESRVGNN